MTEAHHSGWCHQEQASAKDLAQESLVLAAPWEKLSIY
jgi:hypothetical protein